MSTAEELAMTHVREAIFTDVPAILEMGGEFVARAWDIEFNEIHTRNNLFEMIRSPAHRLLVAEDHRGKVIGMIGFLLYPTFWNAEHLMAQEMFWWVDPLQRESGAGLALLREMEAEAKRAGGSRRSGLTASCDRP